MNHRACHSSARRLAWLLSLAVLAGALPASADFVLTEFMAANSSSLADEDGVFSDWLEIHNPAGAPTSIGGWFLTDNPDDRTKWQFPETNIAANGYLVLFASSHDRRSPGAPLHTNFRLAQDSGYVALVRPDGSIATEFGSAATPYPPQSTDLSYGLTTNIPPAEKYFTTPTPGGPNAGGLSNVRITPLFSVTSGVFTNSVTVALSSPLSGAAIRYTLNGVVPTNTSTLYTAPLTFTSSTRLRAALFFNNEPPGPPATESYLRLAASAQGFSSPLPIVVLDNFGAGAVPGVNSRGPNGDGSQVVEVFLQPLSLLIFDRTNGTASFTNPPVLASRAGLKLRGSSSFNFVKKSYALETWGELNEQAHDLSLLGLPAESDWVLYGPSPEYDASLIHNSFIYELANQSGYAAPRTRFVEVFLNTSGGSLSSSHYAGLYILTEKVKRSSHRVDFDPLSTNGLSGGWMLNADRMDALPPGSVAGSLAPRHFHTAGPDRLLQTEDDNPRGYQGPSGGVGIPPPRDDMPNFYFSFFNFESPSGWDITPAQRAPIQAFMRALDASLYGPNFTHPVNGYAPFIDVDNFVHHFILHNFTKNQDGEVLSTFFVRASPAAKLRHGPIWDFDRGYNTSPASTNPATELRWISDRLFYPRLFQDVNFNQAAIDRWQDLRRGAFATSNLLAIVDAQTNEITGAVATRNGTSGWAAKVGAMRDWLVARAAAIDAQYLAPPVFNQNGGPVPNGFQLAISAAGGTIYFSLDGTDPRAPGGGVASSAQAYSLPFTLNSPTTVFARLKSGANWSGVSRATFFTPQNLDTLRLTEIMYHAPDSSVGTNLVSGDEFEYIEFKNTGPATLDLSGLNFASGIDYSFPVGTMLAPGQFFVLGRNAAMLQAKYPGLVVQGLYSGKLDNGGERLELSYASGVTLLSLNYNDTAPWPVAADGHGFSLVPRDPAVPGDPGSPLNWRASTNPGGSPGADDPPNAIPPVLINEVLSASESPDLDAVELFNPAATTVDVGGWFLTDDAAVPKKFRIPEGTLLGPMSHLVLDESQFNAAPGTNNSFAFNSAGDEVYLFSGDATTNLTGYSHGFSFGGAEAGVTFGRVVLSTGEELFTAQVTATLGTNNSAPRLGPIIVSEIHYHPDPGEDEFVELSNISPDPVALFDPLRPTNTWRLNGLGFLFPTNLTLDAGQPLLLVATNPAGFRAKYSVPPAVPIFGPYPGRLQDGGELLELQKPYASGTNNYFATVDSARYDNKAPWPPAADGGGFSLQRKRPAALGSDPANWEAAPPTPGADPPPGLAPAILAQPPSRVTTTGRSVTFRVIASGSEPLFCQWRFNGAPIPGAGTTNLVLAHVQPPDAGLYSVLVYNAIGSEISADASLTVLNDTDGDGLPDTWETAHLLSPTNAADAEFDTDGDGMTNWQEYIAGTDPRDAASFLKVNQVAPGNGILTVEFLAISNRFYTVEFTDGLEPAAWQHLADVDARATNRIERVPDLTPGARRFYRLTIPPDP